ncbi:hypothetical protein [Pontibacter sp. SGAir0037]|uniref:hypothetical protein n=1 Tax=Pontibacter sp. SGAir0037 TaxID=2571030 RepID=UPI0010CD0FF8|nr:hypothetical protein [Pontibacter sp. SGAir0037]QCR21103.1 hypothetical protein C1N53_01130 [Pontibacter sp. SGAir0037]QCR23853.1 hypothetical protein C1N53_16870 [Pontibacter sp. SGAir0037]
MKTLASPEPRAGVRVFSLSAPAASGACLGAFSHPAENYFETIAAEAEGLSRSGGCRGSFFRGRRLRGGERLLPLHPRSAGAVWLTGAAGH